MFNSFLQEATKLTKPEIKELIKKLVNTLDGSEIWELIEEIQNELEILGVLKTIEPAFEEWDNDDDSIYDTL